MSVFFGTNELCDMKESIAGRCASSRHSSLVIAETEKSCRLFNSVSDTSFQNLDTITGALRISFAERFERTNLSTFG